MIAMRGVQFLSDYQGKKIAALVDLIEHHEFWEDVLAECNEPVGFQFLVNDRGDKVAVLLDFEQHGELWEDICDNLAVESRKDEPRIPWEKARRQLRPKSELSV